MSHNEELNGDEPKNVEEKPLVTKRPKMSTNYKKNISFILDKIGINKSNGWWNK